LNRATGPAAWVAKADHDLLAAAEIPWDTVCFHAQQAGEKLLRAYLLMYNVPPERTHDWVKLLSRCITTDPSLADLESECVLLSGYGVLPRYPDDLTDLDEAAAQTLVTAAERIRTRIVPLLQL
jgi:HEPN domain-containing protein